MQHYPKESFVYNLVLTLTGVDVHTLESDKAHQVAHEAVGLFVDYISFYIEKHYTIKDAIRVRTAYETGEDILKTFPELVPMYEEAYKAFLVWLEENLHKAHDTLK